MLRQLWAAAAAVFVLAVYAVVLGAMPKEAFWSPDEGAKFIQLHSVEWRDGLHYSIPYGGERLDPEFAFYPTRCRYEDLYPVRQADGGVKFHWPIWFPFATGMLVNAFGPTGLYVVPLLSGWLIALLAGWLMRAWDSRFTPLAILAVGLATPIAFFSVTFWEHTLATLLGLAALCVIAASRPLSAAPLWAGAPLLLAAAALRIEMLLFGVALACAWLVAGRWARDAAGGTSMGSARLRAPLIVLALLAVAALLVLFTVGIPERHRWILSVLPNYLLGSFAKLPYLIETLTAVLIDSPGNQAPEIADALRYAVFFACAVALAAPLLRAARTQAIVFGLAALVLLQLSTYLIVRPAAYVSLHGFLPVAPFIVLAGFGVRSAWRERRHAQLAIAAAAAVYLALVCAVIFVFLVSEYGETPVGLEWGSRYLFSLYPLGAVLGLAGLRELRLAITQPLLRGMLTALAGGLLVCGVLLEARGVWTLLQSRQLVTEWQAALRDGPPVVTDVWWLPAAMAPLFIAHEVHCVRQGDLTEFLPAALRHDVNEFTYASFGRFDAGRAQQAGITVQTEDSREISGLRLTRVRIAPSGGS